MTIIQILVVIVSIIYMVYSFLAKIIPYKFYRQIHKGYKKIFHIRKDYGNKLVITIFETEFVLNKKIIKK